MYEKIQHNKYDFSLLQIEWRDPWLIALFTFHLSIFMMAVFTRNYGNFQALLFFCLRKLTTHSLKKYEGKFNIINMYINVYV